MAEEKEGTKKVEISDECIGCGTCATHTIKEGDKEIELFDISSGKSEFIYTGEMTNDVIEAVKDAIEGCPVQAISIE